jgi:hypothetical protein
VLLAWDYQVKEKETERRSSVKSVLRKAHKILVKNLKKVKTLETQTYVIWPK